MAPDHRNAIIGARANGRIASAIPGTRTIACEKCAAPTLFAPSSLARPEAAGAMFVCLTCAAELVKESPKYEVGAITEAQLAELRKAGVLR
jgi:hypothetical protein